MVVFVSIVNKTPKENIVKTVNTVSIDVQTGIMNALIANVTKMAL